MAAAVKQNGVGGAKYPAEGIGPEVARNGGLARVEVHLTGVSPLLMNAMSQEQLLAIHGKVKAPKTAARPIPRDEAEGRLHRLPDGTPHVPVQALTAALVNAGVFVRMDGRRQVSSAKSTNLFGMLAIEDTTLPLWVPGEETHPSWEVDIQQGRNPNGGEAVCLIRPRFDAWELRLTAEVDQREMPLQMARDLFDIAGRRMGLLDFRPQRKGPFGRFAVSLWKRLD